MKVKKLVPLQKGVFNAILMIAKLWKLTDRQLAILLIPKNASADFNLMMLKEDKVEFVEEEMLERMSYLLGIYKMINILIPNQEGAARWIKKPNNSPLFQGKSALARMSRGSIDDIRIVWRYLKGQ